MTRLATLKRVRAPRIAQTARAENIPARYLVDEQGKRVAVVLDLAEYRRLKADAARSFSAIRGCGARASSRSRAKPKEVGNRLSHTALRLKLSVACATNGNSVNLTSNYFLDSSMLIAYLDVY